MSLKSREARKLATAGIAALSVFAFGASSAQAAFVPPATLKYDCKYPLVDKKPLSIYITSNIPTYAKYDTLQPKFIVDAVATAGGGTGEAIDTLDAQFIEGVSEARASLVYQATGYEQKNLKVPLTVDRWTKPVDFDIADDLVLGAKGSTPAVTLDEYGKVDIRVDSISLNLKAFYADNTPIDVKKLKTNYEGVAVTDSDGDPFTFDVYCKLLPESSPIIATICVNDTGIDDGSCGGTTPPVNKKPNTVTGLKVDAKDQTSATLSWTPSTDPDAGDTVKYDVFRGTTKVATGITPANFKDTGLTAGTKYSYTVVATDGKADGAAPASAALEVTTDVAPPVNQPPAKVVGLKADAKDQTSVTLSWTASVDPNAGDVVKYDVFRGTTKVATAISPTTFKDSGLTAKTEYSYTVVASDGKALGTAAASDALKVTTDDVAPPVNKAPAKVTGLKSDAKDQTSVTLSWGASVDPDGDAVKYDVLRGTTKVATAISATTFKDTGLTAKTEYSYTVVASDGKALGTAAASDALKVTTDDVLPPVDDIAPSDPGDGAYTDADTGENFVVLRWTASTDTGGSGLKGYEVEFETEEGSDTVFVPAGTTSKKFEGLGPNTAYTYIVTAVDNAGNTSGSNIQTRFTFKNNAPTAPTNVKAGTVTETTIPLTWTASTDPDVEAQDKVVGYNVYVNGAKANGNTPVATAAYTAAGLSKATSYDITVAAVDSFGLEGAKSAVLTQKTAGTIDPVNVAPTKVVGLKSTAKDQTSVTLAWTASTDANGDAVKYDVLRGTTKVATAISAVEFKDTGLTAKTEYSYTVVASDGKANGTAAPSDALKVTTDDVAPPVNKAPAKVTGLKSDAKDQTSVTLSWGASVDPDGDAVKYDVLRGTTKVATAISATTFKDTGLTAKTEYSYTVVASDGKANGTAAASDALKVTTSDVTPPVNQAPTKVIGVKAGTIGATSVALSWTASTDPDGQVKSYNVYKNGVKAGSATGTSTTISGLTAETAYKFTVEAIDDKAKAGPLSDELAVTTAKAPIGNAPVVKSIIGKVAFAKIGGVAIVQGSGFSGLQSVTVGGKPATTSSLGGNLLLVVLPPLAKGTYDLVVTTATGSSAVTNSTKIKYISLF